MKLIRIDGDKFEFKLGPKEKELLLHVINLYPLVPETHHRLSQGGQIPDPDENQCLLDDALKAQRLANKEQVMAMLNTPEQFAAMADGFRVDFARGEIEWLLQVLNDVRIGSWLALGSPRHAELKQFPANNSSLRHAAIMEIAGGFESAFLGAVSGELPPERV